MAFLFSRTLMGRVGPGKRNVKRALVRILVESGALPGAGPFSCGVWKIGGVARADSGDWLAHSINTGVPNAATTGSDDGRRDVSQLA